MKIKYNRFAILPHCCTECKKTFWLEPYKHCSFKEFRLFGSVEYVTNICKECANNLELKGDNNEI